MSMVVHLVLSEGTELMAACTVVKPPRFDWSTTIIAALIEEIDEKRLKNIQMHHLRDAIIFSIEFSKPKDLALLQSVCSIIILLEWLIRIYTQLSIHVYMLAFNYEVKEQGISIIILFIKWWSSFLLFFIYSQMFDFFS